MQTARSQNTHYQCIVRSEKPARLVGYRRLRSRNQSINSSSYVKWRYHQISSIRTVRYCTWTTIPQPVPSWWRCRLFCVRIPDVLNVVRALLFVLSLVKVYVASDCFCSPVPNQLQTRAKKRNQNSAMLEWPHNPAIIDSAIIVAFQPQW